MSATYSYQGDLFTTSSGVYNETMCIKGQFSLSKPLEPNSSYEKKHFSNDSNFSFSFSDGYNLYSSDDQHIFITQDEGFEFSITTDDNSKPKLWFIYLCNNALAGEDIASKMSTGKDARPECFDNATTEQQTGPDLNVIGEGKVHTEGTWTITYDTAPAAPKYSYQGDLFTTSSGVYNDTMCIKGQFSLSEPLEPNSSYEKKHFCNDSNFSFSFSDGYNLYSSDDQHIFITQDEGFEFSITTDDNSKPKLWFIYLCNNALAGEDIASKMSTGKDARPECFDNATTEQQTGPDSNVIGEGKVHTEGTWTITYDTALAAPKILDIKIK